MSGHDVQQEKSGTLSYFPDAPEIAASRLADTRGMYPYEQRPRELDCRRRRSSSSTISIGVHITPPRVPEQTPRAPVPHRNTSYNTHRLRRQRRRQHGGHNRLRGAQEEETKPLIVIAKQEFLDASTSVRDDDVNETKRCDSHGRRRRINQLGTNKRPLKQDKRALRPHKDVFDERTGPDADSIPRKRLDEQPQPRLVIQHRSSQSRCWFRTVDADDSEADHVRRSTNLETRRRTRGDIDIDIDIDSHSNRSSRDTILRPPSSTGAVAAPRSRPTSLYGAPPASSYPSSSASTTTARPRPPSETDRLSSKPSVSSLSSATTTTSTRTARAGSITTAPSRQPPKQSQPPHLARQQAQQRHPSPASPPRTTKPSVLRPAFSTLQQHYSPAKSLAPKPLTATYLAAPSPSKLPANVALTAETSRLQTELLQLHLLHRDLPQVTSQWHASARSKLAARHADLARSARDLAALESDAAERRNLAALRNWATTPTSSSAGGGKISSLPLEDRIQRLDALLTSLWSLDSPGGKHHRLVRAFERWASTLSDLEAARARAQDSADPSALLDGNADVRFGGGLDARWKDDAAALVRRLEGWDAQLRELEYRGDDDGGENDGDAAVGTTTQASSLKRMLGGCGSLVRDMLDELAVMEDIEAAAVERENEWIKRMNREGDDGRGRDTQRAGAIWRVI
ncbi:hypothetical protein BDP81DRAFT_391248 [Colletotrichum phormii]|uniref:Uncharacterized protein n=1 Tax=Colletotrichum phormii TaxID=359342 RepID=A0AAJ0EJ16_9PEZI|nr:uncharacterized protein BDP81DRAFT_391248 [Colletotrichum phormii]KAK1640569.1 hypothetical protein BDP81DRAFT_391248 [Colletotrichum phormii]